MKSWSVSAAAGSPIFPRILMGLVALFGALMEFVEGGRGVFAHVEEVVEDVLLEEIGVTEFVQRQQDGLDLALAVVGVELDGVPLRREVPRFSFVRTS